MWNGTSVTITVTAKDDTLASKRLTSKQFESVSGFKGDFNAREEMKKKMKQLDSKNHYLKAHFKNKCEEQNG